MEIMVDVYQLSMELENRLTITRTTQSNTMRIEIASVSSINVSGYSEHDSMFSLL